MAKFIACLLIAFTAISSSTAKSGSSISIINHNLLGIETQGGVLEFKSFVIQRFENSFDNTDSLFLSDYSGLPLKAIQLKILVGNNGKLKLKSILRGSSIPASSFMFDYQVHKGEIRPDGSSVDAVIVVLLGNGNNVLNPKQSHHILSIEYDVVQIENETDSTSIKLTEVLGATCMPVQDANIIAGEEKTIFLKKQSVAPSNEIILEQNYPNPFNPSTRIRYQVSSTSHVTLKIYDVLGNEIEALVDEIKPVGVYQVNWNASEMPSGVYFYQVNSGSSTDIKKMILIK
jgi:hypothetical protein